MHLGDSIFIFILALVLFGPKKLPEMARQIGKLMAEFRRASNDFRLQIDEELRSMERQEQQQKQEKERAALASGAAEPSILPPALAGEQAAGNSLAAGSGALGALESGNTSGGSLQVLPPSIGEQVSAGTPYAVSASSATTEELGPAEDHPLLRVDSIPDYAHTNGNGASGLALAQANAAELSAQGVENDSPADYGLSEHATTSGTTSYDAGVQSAASADRSRDDAPRPASTLAGVEGTPSEVAEAEQAPLSHG